MWTSFAAIAFKETLHIRRDARLFRSLAFAQFLQLLGIGFLDQNAGHIPTVIVDQDRSSESRQLAEHLRATKELDIKYSTSSISQARDHLRTGRASVAVVVPPDYHRDRAAGGTAKILTLLDGADPASSGRARAAVDGVLNELNVTARAGTNAATIIGSDSPMFNPEGRSAVATLPAILSILISVNYMNMVGLALVREREFGNLERLLMTPLNYLGFMLGKVFPYFVLSVLNGILYVAVIHAFFQVPIRGNPFLVVLGIALYAAAVLAIGVYAASDAPTMRDVPPRLVVLLIPTFFLTGATLPLSSVPPWLQPVSFLLPATHMNMIMRGVMLRGAHLEDALLHYAYLALLCALLLTAAARKFKASLFG